MKKFYALSEVSSGKSEVYIYSDIGWGVSAQQFAEDMRAIPQGNAISLRISCAGGMINEGWAMHSLISERKDKVVAYVDGLAASMASVVMCAASKVVAAAGSWIMIHNGRSGSFGTAEDLRREADIIEKMSAKLLAVYVAKTGKPEAEVKAAMDAETWFTAEEAKAFGLVDEIVGEVSAQACAHLGAADLAKIKAPAALATFLGGRSASANHQPKHDMKNLLKAMAEAKMIGSADVNEETACAQFAAYLSTNRTASAGDADKIKTLEADLAAANAKLAETEKKTAETAVASAVASGRLKDDADLRAKWVASYVRDPKGTQAMLDAIPEAKNRPGSAPVGTSNSQPQQQAKAGELSGRDRVASAWSNLKA